MRIKNYLPRALPDCVFSGRNFLYDVMIINDCELSVLIFNVITPQSLCWRSNIFPLAAHKVEQSANESLLQLSYTHTHELPSYASVRKQVGKFYVEIMTWSIERISLAAIDA